MALGESRRRASTTSGTTKVRFARATSPTTRSRTVPITEASSDRSPQTPHRSSHHELTGTITYVRGAFHPNELQIQAEELAPFEERFPGLDVRTSLFDWGTRDETLTAAFAGPKPPDVSYHSDSTWGRYGAAGALLDITDRVTSKGFRETYEAIPEAMWEAIKVDGKVYGVPVYAGLYGLHTNRDLLTSAGVEDWHSSWDALLQAAKATRRGPDFGWGNTFTFSEFGHVWYYGFLFANGGSLLTDDLKAGNLNTPAGVGAFEIFRDLYASGAAAAPDLDERTMAARFAEGHLAMMPRVIDRGTGNVRSYARDFAVEQQPYPQGPLGDGEAAPGTVGVVSIATASQRPEAAWELIRYLSDREQQISYLRRFNGAFQSVRTDVPLTAITGPDEEQDTVDEVERASSVVRFPQPVPQISDINRAICDSLQAVARGRQQPAEAAQECNDAIGRILGS